MVCYTGVQSKLILNLGQYIYKRSSFERILNWILVANLLLALVCATIISIGYHSWQKK